MSLLELQKLEYFMRVAQCEHMTQAANDLHMTQPALSRIISQVEAEVGVKLFDRAGKTLRLNDSGRVVYESATRIFEELHDMQERLSDLTDGTRGRLAFASSFPYRETDWIVDAIQRFLRTHGEVEFFQIQKNAADICVALEKREIDIALCDRPILGSGIKWHEVFTERLGVILSTSHPLAKYPVLGLEDLVNEPFFCNDDSSQAQDITSYICEKSGFRPHVKFRGDFPSLIGTAVGQGKGVAFVSEGAYRYGFGEESSHVWNPMVTFRPIRDEYCRRVFGVAVLKDRYLPKVVQEFYDLLVDYDIEAYRKQLNRSGNSVSGVGFEDAK